MRTLSLFYFLFRFLRALLGMVSFAIKYFGILEFFLGLLFLILIPGLTVYFFIL